jgi:hypothetical protein
MTLNECMAGRFVNGRDRLASVMASSAGVVLSISIVGVVLMVACFLHVDDILVIGSVASSGTPITTSLLTHRCGCS